MLIFPKPVAGVTLIELMIVIVIIGILLILGLPEASIWMQNTRIRTAAESMSNGLQIARSEAVRRNTPVEFVLTNNSPVVANVGTAPNTTGPNWIVRVYEPPNPYAAADFIQGAAETSPKVVINSGVTSLVFTNLGRYVVCNPPVTPPVGPVAGCVTPAVFNDIQITNPTGGVCIAAAGPMRCLTVRVQTGGQIRMCDPSIAAVGDSRAC